MSVVPISPPFMPIGGGRYPPKLSRRDLGWFAVARMRIVFHDTRGVSSSTGGGGRVVACVVAVGLGEEEEDASSGPVEPEGFVWEGFPTVLAVLELECGSSSSRVGLNTGLHFRNNNGAQTWQMFR